MTLMITSQPSTVLGGLSLTHFHDDAVTLVTKRSGMGD